MALQRVKLCTPLSWHTDVVDISIHTQHSPYRVYSLQEEPPELRGLLFQQERNGDVRVLKYSGQTNPDGPPDIPEDAAIDDEVFISVDGIGQDWDRHRSQIQDWFHGGADYGTELRRPIIGIHEGEGKSGLHDGLRIVKNTLLNKGLQSGWMSPERVRELAYKNDPSVKTIHDQLRQSLQVGRQVTFMAHSGGAAQVALAMSLLATDNDRDWSSELAEKVRVLGTAPAAHRKDFEWAGVKPENIMITGSKKDPVYRFFSNYLEPLKPWSVLPFLYNGVKTSLKFLAKPGPYHQGEYIFSRNKSERGVHAIGEFLDGGPGADKELP